MYRILSMLQNIWMHWIMLKLHGLPNEGKEGEKKKKPKQNTGHQ